mgnify:CR=1 FL=1
MSTIEIKNLHFSYTEGEEILKGLNFNIDERSTAIIGQNGAGKTTLLSAHLMRDCHSQECAALG